MLINKVGSSETLSQVTNTDGYSQFKLEPTNYNLSETMKDNWYQSGIYCEDTSGVMITTEGEAYGHHGQCEGWNGCGDAATCAQWACELNGYDQLVSYGDQRPCTQFNNCHLFADMLPDYQSYCSYENGHYIDWNWGNWCDVMGVSGIICKNNSGINNNDNLSAAYIARDESSLYTHQFTVEPGKTKTCYVGNYQKATITVNKNVLDSQGGEIEDNSLFTLSATGLGQTSFSELSPVTYTVDPGTYNFSEINIDSGYVLKSANDVSVTVTSGESKSIEFTNWRIPPELSISKTNNRWPTAQTVGAEVEYTITLGLTQNDIKDVTIIDLPPHGFTYKSGSYKVLVNGIPRNIAQPSYSSPGIWYLGDLQKDDLVLLPILLPSTIL